MHCQSAVPSCNDTVHNCHFSNKMYYASRTVYSNNLCNGTSSNWKADSEIHRKILCTGRGFKPDYS